MVQQDSPLKVMIVMRLNANPQFPPANPRKLFMWVMDRLLRPGMAWSVFHLPGDILRPLRVRVCVFDRVFFQKRWKKIASANGPSSRLTVFAIMLRVNGIFPNVPSLSVTRREGLR